MKLFTANNIRQWDAYTIEHEPINSIDLMERAANACYHWLIDHFNNDPHYIIFCGTGNNGGDGLAIARLLLLAEKSVQIFLLEEGKRSADFETNFARLQPLLNDSNIIIEENFSTIEKEAVIIDALYGTGLSRPLVGKSAEVVNAINRLKNKVISIDIPSGLFTDQDSTGNPIVIANHTLSFQTHKLAFMMTENGQYTGNIHILNIGLHQSFYNSTPTPFYTIDQNLISSIFKPRNQSSHKYNFGHALLYVGSKNMMGAAVLCAKACLKSGVGLVTVHTEEQTQAIIQTSLPESICSTESDWKTLAAKKAAIGIGPGMELLKTNETLLKELLYDFDGGLVVDASALQILVTNLNILNKKRSSPVILTPHTGEFEKLFGKTSNDFERLKLCMEKAKEHQCFIVLKGPHTLIASPDGEAYFNTTGNAGMATAGSGDVLTGILTGLLAQGYAEKDACILGVYLHGLAGDIGAKKISQEALISGDIIDYLGEAFKQVYTSL
ncbi:MAG: NAD(P)H-hydrate dehydratase [Ferruginibacter sp.]